MNRPAVTLLILMLGGTLPACAPFRSRSSLPPPPVAEEQAALTASLPPPEAAAPEREVITTGEGSYESISGEITRLLLITRNQAASAAERSESWRRLALLYLSQQNPARDLKLAAAAQTAYLETLAPGSLRKEAEIWLELITMADEGEHLLRQQMLGNKEKDRALAALGAEKQRLLQKVSSLETSNAKLKGDIEKLKFIDLSMEKKRQSFR